MEVIPLQNLLRIYATYVLNSRLFLHQSGSSKLNKHWTRIQHSNKLNQVDQGGNLLIETEMLSFGRRGGQLTNGTENKNNRQIMSFTISQTASRKTANNQRWD